MQEVGYLLQEGHDNSLLEKEQSIIQCLDKAHLKEETL